MTTLTPPQKAFLAYRLEQELVRKPLEKAENDTSSTLSFENKVIGYRSDVVNNLLTDYPTMSEDEEEIIDRQLERISFPPLRKMIESRQKLLAVAEGDLDE